MTGWPLVNARMPTSAQLMSKAGDDARDEADEAVECDDNEDDENEHEEDIDDDSDALAPDVRWRSPRRLWRSCTRWRMTPSTRR